jgi:hypothetical protein
MKQITHLHPLPKRSPWVELIPSLPHMPAWRAQTGAILPFSMCLKVVNEHYIARAKLIWCLCSLHLFVRWSVRNTFLCYIFINTVYFIPVYSKMHADVWSKVEGSFILLSKPRDFSNYQVCSENHRWMFSNLCLCTEDHCWVVNV